MASLPLLAHYRPVAHNIPSVLRSYTNVRLCSLQFKKKKKEKRIKQKIGQKKFEALQKIYKRGITLLYNILL